MCRKEITEMAFYDKGKRFLFGQKRENIQSNIKEYRIERNMKQFRHVQSYLLKKREQRRFTENKKEEKQKTVRARRENLALKREQGSGTAYRLPQCSICGRGEMASRIQWLLRCIKSTCEQEMKELRDQDDLGMQPQVHHGEPFCKKQQQQKTTFVKRTIFTNF